MNAAAVRRDTPGDDPGMSTPGDHSTGTPLRRRMVPRDEVLAIFATAPAIDADECAPTWTSSWIRRPGTRSKEPACDAGRRLYDPAEEPLVAAESFL